jgi:hypothetical protein
MTDNTDRQKAETILEAIFEVQSQIPNPHKPIAERANDGGGQND